MTAPLRNSLQILNNTKKTGGNFILVLQDGSIAIGREFFIEIE